MGSSLGKNTDLTEVVGDRGVAVPVPYHWKDSDVKNVLGAIRGKYKPTPKPTPLPTTRPLEILDCLFIGDLYNFGRDAEKYVVEMELINWVGHNFFALKEHTTAGLWAYGYTSFPASPDISNFTETYEEFRVVLEKMNFANVSNPITTARRNTLPLPVLYPKSKEIKRIVAVGFDNTDLSETVGKGGIAVSVPYFWKEPDVANILEAIQGRKPVPKPPTTTKLSTEAAATTYVPSTEPTYEPTPEPTFITEYSTTEKITTVVPSTATITKTELIEGFMISTYLHEIIH
ncbi:hypothetical protein OESDEN_04636 [Oesophagostomum dentatum]|uniref:Uncharacterized protein n=1 Tax=Oesophagostomum dentatum TaxID=61180 RepID=A0A0B1TH28_OESDE|nr:hypothetical protein OESDEN_04636 [Oesophagostomum dentatum]